MNGNRKPDPALWGLTALFAVLIPVLLLGRSPGDRSAAEPALVDDVFRTGASIRLSARELIEDEGDTSGMECYACHEEGKIAKLHKDEGGLVAASTNHLDLVYARLNCAGCHKESEEVDLEWDDDDNLIIPLHHRQPPMRHGRFGRNNDCYNCHVPEKLDKVRTRKGELFDLKDSTQLCASCHGPAYREWEQGVHGRQNGYWNRKLGESARQDCTSCHDPHSPAFPSMRPAPGIAHTAERAPTSGESSHE